ncbi:FtsW/RodA/SpoVE family cell cycle protein, partial [Pelagibacterales bacterium SAG-MED24]|nr:FtsW/RodA/SpoVE family cell cycle protein [Pelagibacterales bacterium SAG-MED24]
MYQHTRFINNRFSFFQKFKNLDYILLICILILGFISLTTMYSTDGGKVLFHTKSHFIKLIIFTSMMLIISFINIKFWFLIGYIFYLTVVVLLIWTDLFGIKSSGSQRWIDLYFINIQPSELMKICIILCLAKYFHRMKIENVNSIYTIFTSLIIILLP